MSPRNQYHHGRGRGFGRGHSSKYDNYLTARHGQRSVHPQNTNYKGKGTRSHTADIPVPATIQGDLNDLSDLLKSIDGGDYRMYKSLLGGWKVSNEILLILDKIQGDAFAPPSRARLRIPLSATGFDPSLYSTPIRTTAFCDYLTRKFSQFSHVTQLDFKCTARRWASSKGGNISIDTPGQHVLPRTSCVVGDDVLELRITIALPARGRTVEAHAADEGLTRILPIVAEKVLHAQDDDTELCAAHVRSVDEQDELRNKLSELGLVGFVADGAILPRESGNSDKPMLDDLAAKFKSPDSLAIDVTLSSGRHLRGMAFRQGISLIVGGGFHGKSTLLSALQVGVYNHVPGDGREFVCVIPQTVPIRSEDGRSVVGVDITPFINNLPFGRSTESFTTENASGSTSQAANIIEALDAGAKLLLTDEDLSATNFMVRDERMQKLVPADKEPITPMIQRIRGLYLHEGVSSILVIGGAGDYFDVSDWVIMMDCYNPVDVTDKAKALVSEQNSSLLTSSPKDLFKPAGSRKISSASLQNILASGKGRVFARAKGSIEVGDRQLDIGAVSSIIEVSQTKAIGAALEKLGAMPELETEGVTACIDMLMKDIERFGLDTINCRGELLGHYARPRSFDLHAALNRLRGLEIGQ